MNKNSLVRFKDRPQTSTAPMRVQAVKIDVTTGKREFKVNGSWWPEACFISDDDWRKEKI